MQTTPLADVPLDVSILATMDWWQGSVVALPVAGGEELWVISSQTCNLVNCSLERVPLIEIVRAEVIPAGEVNVQCAKGDDPRRFHVPCEMDGQAVHLQLRIEERKWIPRETLLDSTIKRGRILNVEGKPEAQHREDFAAWLARSYTRMELPDELNALFERTKLREFISKRLVRDADVGLQGIYLRFATASGADIEPAAVPTLAAPYFVEIVVVCYDNAAAIRVANAIEALSEKTVPVADRPKISRLEAAKNAGLSCDFDVVLTTDWTVADLGSCIRFTNWDYLSAPSQA